jgi:hypothetical protein
MRWQKNKHSGRPVNLARLSYSEWLCLFLLLGLTACSSASPSSAQAAPPTSSAPSGAASNGAVTPPATSSPAATSSPTPFTSPAPTAPATPNAASRTGWKTYVSTKLQITIDYPSDWSVREEAANVTFVSPQGTTIQLFPIQANGLSPEEWFNQSLIPNTRCSSRTNEHGLTVQICLDTLSFTHIANFVISSSGTTRFLSLTMGRRGDAAVFNAMVDSLRPAS